MLVHPQQIQHLVVSTSKSTIKEPNLQQVNYNYLLSIAQSPNDSSVKNLRINSWENTKQNLPTVQLHINFWVYKYAKEFVPNKEAQIKIFGKIIFHFLLIKVTVVAPFFLCQKDGHLCKNYPFINGVLYPFINVLSYPFVNVVLVLYTYKRWKSWWFYPWF